MKRLFLLFLLAGVANVSAQTIQLKSGETVSATGMVRQNDMIMVPVKSSTGSMGQIGINISDIAALNLPPPDAFATVSDLMAKGQFDQALAQIEPVVAFQKTIVTIPGNWWAKAALLKVSVLCDLNREADARALVAEIASSTQDPEILIAAKLQLALITKIDDPQKALTAYDEIIGKSTDPQTLSRAWIAEGDLHFAQHEFDEALLAYLTITVFYPGHNPLAAKALWGAGQSYAKLKDLTNAARTFQELISTYPDSPEAALAKTELMKENKKT